MPTSDGSVYFLPFQTERGKDGGAKLDSQWSLQMRVFVSAGEQVHQGGPAVSETDKSGERLTWCGCQANGCVVCLVKLLRRQTARGVTRNVCDVLRAYSVQPPGVRLARVTLGARAQTVYPELITVVIVNENRSLYCIVGNCDWMLNCKKKFYNCWKRFVKPVLHVSLCRLHKIKTKTASSTSTISGWSELFFFALFRSYILYVPSLLCGSFTFPSKCCHF